MGKNPAFLFYPGDWFREPGLRMVPLYVKGAWAELLFTMFDCPEQGKISGSLEDFGNLLGICAWGENEQHGSKACFPWDSEGVAYEGSALDILRQLIGRKICDAEYDYEDCEQLFTVSHGIRQDVSWGTSVTPCHFSVTLICRRMYRDFKQREMARNRQVRHRSVRSHADVTEGSHADVTTPLSVSVSVSSSDSKRTHPLTPSRGNGLDLAFVRFWEAYPRHEAKQPAYKAFLKAQPDDPTLEAMLLWLTKAKLSDQWQDKGHVPHPATWLNQRRWEADPPPQSRDSDRGKQSIEDYKAWLESIDGETDATP